MRVAGVGVVVALMVAGCGGSEGQPGTISRSTFQGEWPFTVESGVLACAPIGEGLGAVTFTANGTTYGVNGIALNQGKPRVDPIWKKDPSIPGLRVNIGDVLDRGLELCR